MKFEWDSDKAAKNVAKHNIRFDEAAAVFLDPSRLTFSDDRQDYGEERFITIGAITERVHVVAYCIRRGDTIRIISARKANRREQKRYVDSQTHS